MDVLPPLKRGGQGGVGRLVSWRAYPPTPPWKRGGKIVSILVQGIWDTTEPGWITANHDVSLLMINIVVRGESECTKWAREKRKAQAETGGKWIGYRPTDLGVRSFPSAGTMAPSVTLGQVAAMDPLDRGDPLFQGVDQGGGIIGIHRKKLIEDLISAPRDQILYKLIVCVWSQPLFLANCERD